MKWDIKRITGYGLLVINLLFSCFVIVNAYSSNDPKAILGIAFGAFIVIPMTTVCIICIGFKNVWILYAPSFFIIFRAILLIAFNS